MKTERVSIISTPNGIGTRPYHPTVSMLEQAIGHIRHAQELILRNRDTATIKRFLEYAKDAVELADKEYIND